MASPIDRIRRASGLVVIAAVTGCYVTRTSIETGTVHVVTAPPGATVWLEDTCSVREEAVDELVAEIVSTANPRVPLCNPRRDQVGRSPVDVRFSYEVTERRFSNETWFIPLAGVASMLLGGVIAVAGEKPIGYGLVFLGFAESAFSTLFIAFAPDVKVAIRDIERLTIGATLPGHVEDRAVLFGDPTRQPRALRLSLASTPPGSQPLLPATQTQTATPTSGRPKDRARTLPDGLRPDRYRPLGR